MKINKRIATKKRKGDAGKATLPASEGLALKTKKCMATKKRKKRKRNARKSEISGGPSPSDALRRRRLLFCAFCVFSRQFLSAPSASEGLAVKTKKCMATKKRKKRKRNAAKATLPAGESAGCRAASIAGLFCVFCVFSRQFLFAPSASEGLAVKTKKCMATKKRKKRKGNAAKTTLPAGESAGCRAASIAGLFCVFCVFSRQFLSAPTASEGLAVKTKKCMATKKRKKRKRNAGGELGQRESSNAERRQLRVFGVLDCFPHPTLTSHGTCLKITPWSFSRASPIRLASP